MYIDKPMKGHGLMQAIARVNRVFKDKPGGLVVDYIGIAHQLKKALATYTEAGGRGKAAIDQEEAVNIMLEKYDVVVHSVNSSMPLPSVVRINRYIRKPFRQITLNRKNILRRDRHICQYCGKNSKPMTIDHIIPKSYGGDDSWENLVTACLACNNKKADRTPEEANMKLIRKPVKPGYLFYLQSIIRNPHPSWKPYLFMK
jgi:5-methylcytosine-specific restriction endonuclease McrA